MKRRKNPAELVLMGANPSKKRRRHFAIQWDKGSLSNSYRTREEAESVLREFNGKGRIVRVNPMPLRRSNPSMLEEQRARDVRTGFIDQPIDKVFWVNAPGVPVGEYALLGQLAYLAIKPAQGGEVLQLDLEDRGILLIAATDRRQLYFVKGRHSLSDSDLGKFSPEHGGAVELGECRQIGYLAVKYHPEVGNDAAGKEVLWEHPFESPRPMVWYSRADRRLFIKGGAYRVEDAGIVG